MRRAKETRRPRPRSEADKLTPSEAIRNRIRELIDDPGALLAASKQELDGLYENHHEAFAREYMTAQAGRSAEDRLFRRAPAEWAAMHLDAGECLLRVHDLLTMPADSLVFFRMLGCARKDSWRFSESEKTWLEANFDRLNERGRGALDPAALKRNHTFVGIGHGYAEDVVSGKVLACKWIKLACQRQLADLERVGQPAPSGGGGNVVGLGKEPDGTDTDAG